MELKLLFWNTKSRIVIFGYPGGFPYFKIWKSYSSISQRNKLRIRPQVSSDTQIWTGKSKVIFRIKNACIFPRLGEAIILCETRWYAHFFIIIQSLFSGIWYKVTISWCELMKTLVGSEEQWDKDQLKVFLTQSRMLVFH